MNDDSGGESILTEKPKMPSNGPWCCTCSSTCRTASSSEWFSLCPFSVASHE